jgi:hypothetical protein
MGFPVTRSQWTALLVGIAFLCSFVERQPLCAQIGFTPTVYMTPVYGSEWGNTYSGAVMQVPQWGTSAIIGQPVSTSWQNFQLGAYIQNMPNGVLISQVMPGSLAEVNGLKAGDIVVSVGGSQVGYVNGRTVDLVYEMSLRADGYGRVPIMVLDSLTRQIRSYVFSIGQQPITASSVVGQVVLDSGVFLSSYGTLKVELQNATRPFMQVAGGTDNRQVFGRGPYQYSIRFDPQFIYPTDRYRLVATLYDSLQQVIGYTAQDILAPTAGAQTTYNLRLQNRQAFAPGGVNVVGYYPPDMSTLTQLFRQFIGRDPSISEAQAWSSQLATRTMSLNEVKAELIASPAFYDRAGNNPDLFIQRMIESVTGQPGRYDQIQFWRSRLDSYGGMRLAVAREYIATISP